MIQDLIHSETFPLSADKSKSYHSIPFNLEPECDRLEVRYSVMASQAVIDLGMECDGEIAGWSGSERETIFIERDMASPGYAPGLKPGKWAVVLGIVTCGDEGTVMVTIIQHRKQFRWYKGDLHSHSHHSDGRHSMDNIYRFCQIHHFDFISITDHNCYSQNLFQPDDRPILQIPGMELTTYWGHMNFWGVKQPVKDIRVQSRKEIEHKIIEGKNKGAVISLNHPYKGPSIWEYGYEVDFDCLEVWNGPWSEKNQQAVDLWQSMLIQRKQITATGGSDSHGSKKAHSLHYESSHQIPTTWINSDSHSIKGLLENLKKGHAFITYTPDCPQLEMTNNQHDNLMGETVPRGTEVILKIHDLIESDRIVFITEKGSIREETGHLSLSETFTLSDSLFLRLEVKRKTSELLEKYTNLIIRGKEKVAATPDEYLTISLGNPVYCQ